MNKLLVFGYFEKNLGDDLMLKILLDRARMSYADIYILSSKKHKDYYSKLGCKVICYNGFVYRVINRLCFNLIGCNFYYRFLKKGTFDFLMLGGSLFAEGNPEQTKLQLCNLNNAVKRASSSYVIGSNFGPYVTEEYLKQYNALFQKCEDVCFRDEYSYNLFSSLNNVRYAPDVVFSGNWKCIVENSNDYILISLIDIGMRPHLKKYADGYENFIIKLCNYLAKKGEKIILFSMCEKEGDLNLCNRLMSKFNKKALKNIMVKNYESIGEAINIFANAKKVYATRFHAMILATYFSKPTVSIAYDEKVKNFLLRYDVNCKIIEFSNNNFLHDFDVAIEHECITQPDEVKKESHSQWQNFETGN